MIKSILSIFLILLLLGCIEQTQNANDVNANGVNANGSNTDSNSLFPSDKNEDNIWPIDPVEKVESDLNPKENIGAKEIGTNVKEDGRIFDRTFNVSDNQTVKNWHFKNATIFIRGNEHIRIVNNIFENSKIFVDHGTDVTIENNLIKNNGGVSLDLVNADKIFIIKNTFIKNEIAINSVGSNGIIQDSIFENNNLALSSKNNSFFDVKNNVFRKSETAIYSRNDNDLNFINNTFENNNEAIKIKNRFNELTETIENNLFKDNNYSLSIEAANNSYKIKNNYFSNGKELVRILDVKSVNFLNNVLINSEIGLIVSTISLFNAQNNTITGNETGTSVKGIEFNLEENKVYGNGKKLPLLNE